MRQATFIVACLLVVACGTSDHRKRVIGAPPSQQHATLRTDSDYWCPDTKIIGLDGSIFPEPKTEIDLQPGMHRVIAMREESFLIPFSDNLISIIDTSSDSWVSVAFYCTLDFKFEPVHDYLLDAECLNFNVFIEDETTGTKVITADCDKVSTAGLDLGKTVSRRVVEEAVEKAVDKGVDIGVKKEVESAIEDHIFKGLPSND